MNVPIDYQNPAGTQISLAISRISTAKPGLRQGVLLLIPGGPGNSGLALPTTRGLKLPASVTDRYDIIGFDPRGVGQSDPISCDLGPRDTTLDTFLPWPGPGGDITGNIARARRVAAACQQNAGPLADYISTRNEARDIDRIRAALGEPRLSYWGVSYGTYVGAAYATMFADRTDRVVLDSNDDPNPSLVERGWAANFAIGAADRFPDFAAWAADRASTYGLGDSADAVRKTYLDEAAELDRGPRPDLTGNGLRAIMFNALYSDASFPILAATMQAVREDGPLPPIPAPSGQALQNELAVLTVTACNDVSWPRSVSGYAGAVAANRGAYPLTNGMPAGIFACAFWPHQPAEAPVRVSSAGPSNVLLVQNVRDPATPYSGALRIRAAFGDRARMVSVDSGGHESYLANGNACGDAAVTAFLAHGIRPATDIRCPA
ncbi:MAG TPA: alpha/beta hydrolase [Pseudonocardiaceae bacterium]|nr:alpha/beta hydrolase [Pseudonocardiaceae bacterium]